MPNPTPLSIGDTPFPELSETVSNVIKSGVSISKGHIYTADDSGRLIVPVSASGIADLSKGIFQAKADATTPTAEDTDEVQTLIPRSRIIIKADADLVVGSQVDLKSDGTTTTADKVMPSVGSTSKGYLGRIFDIYTQSADNLSKQKTADNDLVIVEVAV